MGWINPELWPLRVNKEYQPVFAHKDNQPIVQMPINDQYNFFFGHGKDESIECADWVMDDFEGAPNYSA